MVGSNGMLALMCMSVTHSGMSDPKAPRALSCVPALGGLEISWDADANADRYDLQMGVPSTEYAIAGHHTEGNETRVIVKYLVPEQKYWFQLVSHSQGHEMDSGWNPMSEKHECIAPPVVKASGNPLSSTPRRRRSSSPRRRRGYFIVDMVREHSSYDGITNHNAADAKGQAWLLGSGWRAGQTCKLALYKVHIKKVSIPSQVTPKGGHGHYANYQSCNLAAGKYRCAKIVPTDCSIMGVNCAAAGNSKYSKDHVGMGVIQGNGGKWYSVPHAGHLKTWHRESQYRKAKCHRGMSASAIKKAFHMHAAYLEPWDSDVSAFSTDGETNETSMPSSLSSSPTRFLV